MSHSKKERERYNQFREHASKNLGLNKNEYNKLRRVSQELSKHGERSANGEIQEKEYFKSVGKSFSKAKALHKAKGLHFHHQTDPRGVALYAAREKIKGEDYNSKGHPIY